MANYQSTHTGAQIDEGVDKANKALVKPDSAPSATSLVAIDNTNAQTALTIGDGLSIENGALKATGGGGGGNSYFEAFTGYQAGIQLSGAGYSFSAFKLHNAITDSLVDVTNLAMSGNYDYIVFTNGQTLASGKITNIGDASDLDLLVITKDGSTILGKNESIDIPGLTTAPFLVKFIRTSSSQIHDVRVQFNLIAD